MSLSRCSRPPVEHKKYVYIRNNFRIELNVHFSGIADVVFSENYKTSFVLHTLFASIEELNIVKGFVISLYEKLRLFNQLYYFRHSTPNKLWAFYSIDFKDVDLPQESDIKNSSLWSIMCELYDDFCDSLTVWELNLRVDNYLQRILKKLNYLQVSIRLLESVFYTGFLYFALTEKQFNDMCKKIVTKECSLIGRRYKKEVKDKTMFLHHLEYLISKNFYSPF